MQDNSPYLDYYTKVSSVPERQNLSYQTCCRVWGFRILRGVVERRGSEGTGNDALIRLLMITGNCSGT